MLNNLGAGSALEEKDVKKRRSKRAERRSEEKKGLRLARFARRFFLFAAAEPDSRLGVSKFSQDFLFLCWVIFYR